VSEIRGATRHALSQLVTFCLDEAVDALVIAGDLYDGDWKDYSTGLFFAGQMARLRQASIPVVWIRGNHDAASQITRHLRLPENVRELAYRYPETVALEELPVPLFVHGQGFESREVTEDLARSYPAPLPDGFNLGLLHTCVTGREGHASYAPCAVETLASKGYDYWALGHVHQREVLSQDPWIVFPGNLQGRHAKETGPKGATLIQVDDAGRIENVDHRAFDVVRWSHVELDASNEMKADGIIDLARQRLEQEVADAEGRLVAGRVTITGTSRAHNEVGRDPERWKANLRAAALDVAGDLLWLEKIRFRTRPQVDVDALAQRDDVVGDLVRRVRHLATDPESVGELLRELEPLQRKLPVELRHGDDALRLDDPEWVQSALEDLDTELLPRLVADEEGS
jgi:DNA repair exonuclease SbcCD nuclease subunit